VCARAHLFRFTTKTFPSMQHRNNSLQDDMPHTFMQVWDRVGPPLLLLQSSRVVRMCLSSCRAICC